MENQTEYRIHNHNQIQIQNQRHHHLPEKSNYDFATTVSQRCSKIKNVLQAKAQEYASSVSRFHNFEVAARIADTTPEKALKGMMLKHEVSVMDLIEWAESSPGKLSLAIIDEKIGDNINYLILLEGLLKLRVLACMRDDDPTDEGYDSNGE